MCRVSASLFSYWSYFVMPVFLLSVRADMTNTVQLQQILIFVLLHSSGILFFLAVKHATHTHTHIHTLRKPNFPFTPLLFDHLIDPPTKKVYFMVQLSSLKKEAGCRVMISYCFLDAVLVLTPLLSSSIRRLRHHSSTSGAQPPTSQA